MGRGYQRSLPQMALALFGLFGQQVGLEGLISANLSCTRHLESFLGSGMGFHLGHVLKFGMAKVVQNNNPAKYSCRKYSPPGKSAFSLSPRFPYFYMVRKIQSIRDTSIMPLFKFRVYLEEDDQIYRDVE